jgi:predicted house-cleaning noncanonical NTP pyrophosphatase (MazG superfamily)
MHKKLVRDHIIARIGVNEKRKLKLDKDYSKAEPEALPYLLADKLLEEAEEYSKSLEDYGFEQSDFARKSRLDELADLYEVIRHLATMDGYSMDNVEDAADDKRRERGSFHNRMLLHIPSRADRRPKNGLIYSSPCSVSFNADLQVTTDGRERGLWFWIRDENLKGKDSETGVLLEWPQIKAMLNEMKKQKEPK